MANDNDSRVAEIEDYLKTIDGEKVNLETKVAQLSEELSVEKDRILRISADFDNFRKRTERERSSLVSNAQGEVVERLLQVLDNFERAKTQIKVETEGEEKINNSYQSIYKQLVEILGSLGVVPVETIGKPFDPLVSHISLFILFKHDKLASLHKQEIKLLCVISFRTFFGFFLREKENKIDLDPERYSFSFLPFDVKSSLTSYSLALIVEEADTITLLCGCGLAKI